MNHLPSTEDRLERTRERELESQHALRTAEHEQQRCVRRDAEPTARDRAIVPCKAAYRRARHVCIRAAPWCMRCGGGPRYSTCRSQWRDQAIASSRLHVPLPDQAWRTGHGRRKQCRNCDVATRRKDHVWSKAAEVSNRLRDRPCKGDCISKVRQMASSAHTEARGREKRERITFERQDVSFDPALPAEPVDLSVWS